MLFLLLIIFAILECRNFSVFSFDVFPVFCFTRCLMGKLNFQGYLILKFRPTCENAKITCFTVLLCWCVLLYANIVFVQNNMGLNNSPAELV